MKKPPADMKGRFWGMFLLIGLFLCAMWLTQGWRSWADRPTQPQRIAAVLVSWGVSPEGFTVPVEQDEIDQRIVLLRSRYSEERVRAANWLASHGVRDAGVAIATAMNDPGTLRPCQLAHSLGQLGDHRWADELVRAANQPWNRDLQICATIGLEKLASDRAVTALIELAKNGTARTTAIEALGVIGDSAALPYLREFVGTTREPIERKVSERAITRIELLNLDDPVPALVERMQKSLNDGRVDEWTLRWIARIGDERTIEVLTSALKERRLSTRESEQVAATLLTLDEAGISALKQVVALDLSSAGIAHSALSVIAHRDGERPVQIR